MDDDLDDLDDLMAAAGIPPPHYDYEAEQTLAPYQGVKPDIANPILTAVIWAIATVIAVAMIIAAL